VIEALTIRGPFHGPTGYDRHVRGFTRALRDLGVATQLIDLPQWGPIRLPSELRDPWFDTLDRPVGARTVLHFSTPLQVRAVPRRVNVNYTMFEATPIPEPWAALSDRSDHIVVPTASSAKMFQAGGVRAERLALCPLGISPEAFTTIVPSERVQNETSHDCWQRASRFLNVAEVSSRKNVPGLLRAWLRATTSDDDAALILKAGFYAPDSRTRFAEMLTRVESETGVESRNAAPVHVVDRLFGDAEMPGLFAAATHYISLSFGEGWDQPMVEAGAAGLRLIAPDHSAYLAYLDPSCATLIPSSAVPSGPLAGPDLISLFHASTWWQPDEEAAIVAIRAAIDGQDRALVTPRERILRDLTWERAARRLSEILASVEAARRWRRFWPGFRWNRRG
jgi:glycosyltransferase involved in cell wall biosynthesis